MKGKTMFKLTRTRMIVPLTFDRTEERPAHAFRVDDETGTVLLALVKCRGGYNLTHWATGRAFDACTSNGKPVTLQEAFQGTLDSFEVGAFTARRIEQSATCALPLNKNADHPHAPDAPAPVWTVPQQSKPRRVARAPEPVQLDLFG